MTRITLPTSMFMPRNRYLCRCTRRQRDIHFVQRFGGRGPRRELRFDHNPPRTGPRVCRRRSVQSTLLTPRPA